LGIGEPIEFRVQGAPPLVPSGGQGLKEQATIDLANADRPGNSAKCVSHGAGHDKPALPIDRQLLSACHACHDIPIDQEVVTRRIDSLETSA